LVDGPVEKVRQLLRPLRDLAAPLGVYFVTGNHEYYWGGQESVAAVEGLGLTVLHNAHRVVQRDGAELVIGGIPDLHGGHLLPGPGLRRRTGGSPADPPRPPAEERQRCGRARSEPAPQRPHPRRADLPLPSLRPAPAAGGARIAEAPRRLGLRPPGDGLLGTA